MIVKKIPNPNKSATKAVRIRALAGYIRAPETENETEKCLYAGARGFLCDTAEAQTEEMLALARDAPRSRDPITHYVLSWHDDEHPTPAQVEEIIDLLLHELDVAEHQTIYALHVDTDNTHLHVMLNRVHPDTLKAVEINGGFDIKALHRACARIEQAQGWRAERNACYRVNAAGDIEASARAAPERMPRPPQRLVDEEHRRGEKSAARIAIEEAGPLIEAAESWEALHRRLGERDLRYARSGSGAAVQVGEVFVKASTVSRKATLKGLEARLGPYEGPPATVVSLAPAHEQDGDRGEARHTPDPMRARALIEAARSWEGLHEALAAQGFRYVKRGSGAHVVAGRGEAAVSMKASAVSRRAALRQLEARLGPFEAPGAEGFHEEEEPSQRQAEREERHDAWAQWEAECEAEALALAAHQREERDALRRERSWKGRFLELSLHRSLLAAAHAREKAALEEAFRHGREALEERFLPGKDPAPWRGDPGIAFLWRSRHLEPRALEPASQATQFTDARPPQDIRDYHGRAVGPWVLYATRAQHERGEVAFVDRGKRVTLHERDSDAAALAAMQLAQQKWGRFRARGSEAHKRRSAWLAAKHGLALANPELQGLIAQYRRALGRDQPPPRLRQRERAALLRPPQGPLAEPALRAPPELVQRAPAGLIRPPQGPLLDPALEAPPPLAERGPMTRVRPPSLPRVEVELEAPARVAPRSTPTLTRPPAAPHVGVTLEAPTRLTPRTPAAPMRPPSLPRVEVELEVPPPLAERGPMTRVRPPSLPRVEVKLEVPPRLGQRESVALRSPPAGPSVEAELGAPPELAPRSPAALMHPPQGPLAVPALDAPAWVAPRSTPTLARPPAVPRVEVSLEAPTRLTPRTPAAPIRPPSLPRVEVAPGVPPPLRQRGSVAPRSPPTAPSVEAELGAPPELAPRSTPTLARPPAAPRVEVSLEAPTRLTPRTPAVPIRPPSLPRVEVAPGVPPPLRQCESVAPRSPPTAPSVEAELGAPPELAPRSAPTLARPPQSPKLEYQLVAAYDMDAAREAIELARRHEDLEGQYGELTTLIKPGVVILLDQADEPRYTGAHTLSTAARAWACRLDASFDQLPEVKDALERAVWPDLFQTLNIDARIIEHEALPHLATALRRTVHDRVTQYLSTECRGEGDRRSPVDRLQSELYEALKPRPREGWHPHNDILSSQRSQDRLDEYNASPVRDSQSATLVAKAVAPVLTEIARRHYGQSGKPPEQPSEVPSVEEFSGWRQATRETRRQAALTEYEQKTKARNEVVSEARADWAARAPGLFERLAEEVLYIENQYWHARKAEDEEKKEASLRQRRRKYDQVGDQRSDQGQFSGRGYA